MRSSALPGQLLEGPKRARLGVRVSSTAPALEGRTVVRYEVIA